MMKDLGHGLCEYPLHELKEARADASDRPFEAPLLCNGAVIRVGLTKHAAELIVNPVSNDEIHQQSWPGTWFIPLQGCLDAADSRKFSSYIIA